ncbi:MAG: DUF4249 family protein [Pseudarcicella sp.]|jgi:hypothetical protein|nr:DUF4249 family protein [Pseudarcicella sp.]MBP6410192.1 DUF4249 family protein [Pseudarcicella sp.]
MKKLSIVLLLFSVFSCIHNDVEIELSFEGEKMILNGMLSAKQPIALNITHTFKPAGYHPDSSVVADALVTIYENNKVVDTLRYQSKGNYVSPKDFRFKEGFDYRIEAVSSKYPRATTPTLKALSSYPRATIGKEDYVFRDYKGILDTLKDGTFKIDVRDEVVSDDFYLLYFELNRMDGFIEYPTLVKDINKADTEIDFIDGCKEDRIVINRNGRVYDGFLYKSKCLVDEMVVPKFAVPVSYRYYLPNRTYVGNYSFKNPKFHLLKINQVQIDYFKNSQQPTGDELLYRKTQPTVSNIVGGYGMVSFLPESVQDIELKCTDCDK